MDSGLSLREPRNDGKKRKKAGIAPGLSFFSVRHALRERGIQSPQPSAIEPKGRGVLDRPVKPDDDVPGDHFASARFGGVAGHDFTSVS
jgi:hypothetical protein